MITALHIALKDLRLLLRDRGALFWVLAFPLLFALFFGAVLGAGLGGDTAPLQVRIVSDSESPAARALATQLGEVASLRLQFAELAEAKRHVRRGEALAFIHVPRSFGEPAAGGTASASVMIGIDPSRKLEGAFLKGLVSDVARAVLDPEAQRAAARAPSVQLVAEVARERSGYDLVFPAAVLWGLMGCAAAFAISLVTERTAGTLLRLQAAPIRRSSILLGKALACFFACLVDALLLVGCALLLFDLNIQSSTQLALAIVSACICFSGIMLALSVLGKSEQSVAGAGWATLIVMAMLGGAMVPLSLMPEWLQSASNLSPVKWGIVALEGAIFRDYQWRELLLPCAVLVSIGVVSFASGLAWQHKVEA